MWASGTFMTSSVNPADFCHAGTRRIDHLAAAADAPVVAGAAMDGHIYVWDVQARTAVFDVPASARRVGFSVALSPQGLECFVGAYRAWGIACIDVANRHERWRRRDLKHVRGLTAAFDGHAVVAWFPDRAGLLLDAHTGESVERYVGLREFSTSRYGQSTLKYARQFELLSGNGARYRWPRDSFALLCSAFSPDLCVVSESTTPARAIDLRTGKVVWEYRPREGAHILQLDYSPGLDCFVALEYAYTDPARDTGPMVALLHLDRSGHVSFNKAIREWPLGVFCAQGSLLLNGLGELYDVSTATVTHVFEFPR